MAQSTKDLLRNINAKLCNLDTGSSTVDNSVLEALLQSILDELQSHTEEVTPTLYCDDECNITGAVAFIKLESTSSIIPMYFDANLNSSNTIPTGQPCAVNCVADDYEFKFFEEIKCTTNGEVKEVLCILYVNGIETSTETFWIVDGLKTNTQPVIIDCEVPCEPAVESFFGNTSTLSEYDTIEVFVPKCCEVTLITSAGSLILPAKNTSYYYSKSFNCFLTSYNITSTCDVNTIQTILTKTK